MSRTVNFAAYPSEIASGTDNPYSGYGQVTIGYGGG